MWWAWDVRMHPHAQETVAGHRTSSKARGKVGCSLTYLYQQSSRMDVQGEWKCRHCCVKLSCSCQLALLKSRGVTNPNNRLKVHSIVTPTCVGGFPTDSVLESMHCSYCQLWHCTCTCFNKIFEDSKFYSFCFAYNTLVWNIWKFALY